MSKRYDVLIAGTYSVDLIFTGLPRFPELGKDTIGSGFDMLPGESYNTACTMHRLGLNVGWAVDFGCDDFSRFVIEQARIEGLDDSLYAIHNKFLRRISVSVSFPEDRAFITYYDPDPPLPAILKAMATSSAKVLHIPGLYFGPLLDGGLRMARLKGMKVIMDGNLSEDEVSTKRAAVEKAIRSVDVFLPNAKEACLLSGKQELEKALLHLMRLCPLVVIKDGKNGSYTMREGRMLHAPAIPVDPVDTTGAGDCFNAGFIKAWLDGRSLIDCLRWGNVVGGLSTLKRGATGRRISVEEVEQFLKED